MCCKWPSGSCRCKSAVASHTAARRKRLRVACDIVRLWICAGRGVNRYGRSVRLEKAARSLSARSSVCLRCLTPLCAVGCFAFGYTARAKLAASHRLAHARTPHGRTRVASVSYVRRAPRSALPFGGGSATALKPDRTGPDSSRRNPPQIVPCLRLVPHKHTRARTQAHTHAHTHAHAQATVREHTEAHEHKSTRPHTRTPNRACVLGGFIAGLRIGKDSLVQQQYSNLCQRLFSVVLLV